MDTSSTARVFAYNNKWWDAKDLPASLRKGTLKIIERLKERDFIESVESGGKTWDVYQTISSGQMFFLALRITDEKVAEAVISDSMAGLRKGLVQANQ